MASTLHRIINLSDKTVWFTGDGKDWVLPGKRDAKAKRIYWTLGTELRETPDMLVHSFPPVPRLHPHTKEPIMRRQRVHVLKQHDTAVKGSRWQNFLMVPECILKDMKLGGGIGRLCDKFGIRPSDIVFGQDAIDSLEKELDAKQAEIARLAAEAEVYKVRELGGLEAKKAELETEIAALEARRQAATVDVALAKKG